MNDEPPRLLAGFESAGRIVLGNGPVFRMVARCAFDALVCLGGIDTMAVPYRHITQQGAVLGALGRVALAAASQSFRSLQKTDLTMPGPRFEQVVEARSDALVDDFIRWSGGDPKAWQGKVPPTLFPRWAFPLLGQTLTEIPYPLTKVLNGGCQVWCHEPIPRGQDLHLSAYLSDIDDNGSRVILTQHLTTSSLDGRKLLTANVQMVIPASAKSRPKGQRKTSICVPIGAKPISDWRIPPNAGLSFACLTGDFNPIHWLGPYAKLAGFGRTILHGFGSLAGTMERIRRIRWAGATDMPAYFDVRFTRPLKVPAKVTIFLDGDAFFLGQSPGGRAYLQGHLKQREGVTNV